ncbi:MAG: GNAT family N-acetyltransferase, partial [Treponema sp.]|nr:GNAT family N-acetyltransferase [Treponema sp.]
LLALFNVVFEKDRTIEHFRSQFFNTVLGYSYHALLYDDDRLAGCYSFTPSYYRVQDKRRLCALGLDLMIAKEYRGRGFFQKMFAAGIDYMRADGVTFIITFPNDRSYPGFIKSKLIHDFGCLAVYALPYRIGGVIPALKALNWLSIFLARLFVFITSLFAGSKTVHFPVEKESETYNQTRYTRPDGKYHIESCKESDFVYKIMDYDGVRTAFLIDVFVKSAGNFNAAVKHIIMRHHHEIDLLLYVGRLPFGWHGLLTVPRRLSPENFHFLGQLLQEEVIEADLFFDLRNWDINLSNYDLL